MDMEISLSHDEEEENKHESQPHEALYFVLAYLPVFELLAMSQVCRLMRETLKNDILPWLNIFVQKPLNLRLTDDILMNIASKASGKLKTLALIACPRITDDGLQRVAAQNPHTIKLCIPACTGLTPEGIIRAVKTLTQHNHSLKSLRINGVHNMKKEHLESLHTLLNVNQQKQQKMWHLTLYGGETETDHMSIDVDICPKCNEVRKVFHCSRETCSRKRVRPPSLLGVECRGCIRCIPRCHECGGCIKFEEDCEAACSDLLCTTCWLQLPKCNYCNKPYCNNHAHQQCYLPGSSGFVCDACHAKSISDLSI